MFGLQLVKQVHTSKVILLSNSLQTIKTLQDCFISCPWYLRNLFLDCMQMMRSFESVDIMHVFRNLNSQAHNMAQKGLHSSHVDLECPRWFLRGESSGSSLSC